MAMQYPPQQANPLAGEVSLTLNGVAHLCKLTLGALAALEAALPDHSLSALVARLEGGQISARDIMAVLVAGLRGGGWQGREPDLTACDIAGGFEAAGVAAGRLIALAFAPQLASGQAAMSATAPQALGVSQGAGGFPDSPTIGAQAHD